MHREGRNQEGSRVAYGRESECKRNFTKEQLIDGLKAGRTLVMDRRDAPELDDLLELEAQGLVTQEFVTFDEQSSAVKWRWKR